MPDSAEKRWAQEPRQELVDHVDLLKKGSVLDLGGSDGVNDLYLAQQGFEVTNIDQDAAALTEFLNEAEIQELGVKAVPADLISYRLTENYDNIVSFFAIHFLDKENARQLLTSMQEHTSAGGVNMLMGFTDVGEFNVDPETNVQFYPHENELVDLYKEAGFEILEFKKEMGATRVGKNQERYLLVAKKQ